MSVSEELRSDRVECKRGHLLTEKNSFQTTTRGIGCAVCRRLRTRRRRGGVGADAPDMIFSGPRKTHCRNLHPWVTGNKVGRQGRGLECRQCQLIRHRDRRIREGRRVRSIECLGLSEIDRCINEHLYVLANTGWKRRKGSDRTYRFCLACQRERMHARRREQQEAS